MRDATHPVAANRLERRFDVSVPNEVWVGDITYVWTAQGWSYLAVVIDLFARRVVDWALDTEVSIKRELVTATRWPDHASLRAAVFDYIEVFYNRQRLHSTLDFRIPAQAELTFNAANAA